MQENFVESDFSGGSDRAIKNLFTDHAIKNLLLVFVLISILLETLSGNVNKSIT